VYTKGDPSKDPGGPTHTTAPDTWDEVLLPSHPRDTIQQVELAVAAWTSIASLSTTISVWFVPAKPPPKPGAVNPVEEATQIVEVDDWPLVSVRAALRVVWVVVACPKQTTAIRGREMRSFLKVFIVFPFCP